MPYRIQQHKPKLKSGKDLSNTGVKPALSYDSSSEIIMFKEETWTSIVLNWLKTTAGFAGIAALILALLYFIVSSTLVFGTVVDGKVDLVARGTFYGGVPKTGTSILVSETTPAPDDFFGKLQNGVTGVDKPSIVIVKSGPSDTLTSAGNGINVDGKVVAGKPTLAKNESLPMTLKDSYLVQCVSGACKDSKEDLYVVSKTMIYGQVHTAGAKSDDR